MLSKLTRGQSVYCIWFLNRDLFMYLSMIHTDFLKAMMMPIRQPLTLWLLSWGGGRDFGNSKVTFWWISSINVLGFKGHVKAFMHLRKEVYHQCPLNVIQYSDGMTISLWVRRKWRTRTSDVLVTIWNNLIADLQNTPPLIRLELIWGWFI